jgi:hypothetical protein
MDRPYIEENAKEIKRLRALVERLSDDELARPLGSDWTVAVALAHLAFWDQRSLVLLRKWKQQGVEPSPIDVDVTNESLLPTWLALQPRLAAKLAVEAAEAIDSELAQCPSHLIAEIDRLGDKFRLYRSVHRKLHLDQIEKSLQPA